MKIYENDEYILKMTFLTRRLSVIKKEDRTKIKSTKKESSHFWDVLTVLRHELGVTPNSSDVSFCELAKRFSEALDDPLQITKGVFFSGNPWSKASYYYYAATSEHKMLSPPVRVRG